MTTHVRTDYDDATREELYELAQQRDIAGRSEMTRDELAEALRLDDIGPDAIDLLQRQHAEIRDRFDQFAALSSRPSKRKEEVVGEIVTLLVMHAEVEEQVFYPAVRAELPGMADEADEGLEEHHASELLLAEIDGLASDASRYDAKVHVMIEHMRHHLDEEEEELFALVREQLPAQRRHELGAAMVRQWQVAPSRPHPHGPQTPPGNVATTLVTAVWDAAVDLGRLGWRTAARLLRR